MSYMDISKKVVFPLLSGFILLCGCTGGKFQEEAKKTEAKNQEVKMSTQKIDITKQDAFYKDLQKHLDSNIQETNLSNIKIVDSIKVVNHEYYQDANEFAQFVAQELYNFYTLQITSEQYYNFLDEYGSKTILKDMPKREDAIKVIKTIQNEFLRENITGDRYTLSEVIFDRNKNEGHFYRKVITTNGIEYFITSIKKERDGWKYDKDNSAPPIMEQAATQQEGEGTSN